MYPNLKLQLWKTGLRQNRLAQILNLDETLLSRIVNGFRQPSDELKVRIAEVLHSDIEWLFEAAHDGEPQRTSEQTGR
jgi:transcriptional regulator with XRE-family HTH domain